MPKAAQPLCGERVIELFGGLGPLHKIAGCSRPTCEQWRRAGIAPKYWDILIAEARARGIVEVTERALSRGYDEARRTINEVAKERRHRAKEAARLAALRSPRRSSASAHYAEPA